MTEQIRVRFYLVSQIWLEVDTSHPKIIERIVADRFHDKISYITTYEDIFKRYEVYFKYGVEGGGGSFQKGNQTISNLLCWNYS